MIEKGDIAAIKSEDDHPYYLLKLMKDPFEVETVLKDDYNHVFLPCHRVVVGNYLKTYKATKDTDICYIDWKRKVVISAFSVVGNCLTPIPVIQRRRGKEEEMYLISHDLTQALNKIVNSHDT